MRVRELILDCKLEMIFQNMPERKSIQRHLEKEVKELDDTFEGLEHCRVAVDLPYHHRYAGNLYDFQIEIVFPGNKIQVARKPSADGASSDVFAMMRDAFTEVKQKLDACATSREAASICGKCLTRKEIRKCG